jgi:hypothetical protein
MMLEHIIGNLASYGSAGLLSLVVLMVVTGRLVPSSTVRRLQKTDHWLVEQLKISDDMNQATIVKQLGIIKELTESTCLTNAILSELKPRPLDEDSM